MLLLGALVAALGLLRGVGGVDVVLGRAGELVGITPLVLLPLRFSTFCSISSLAGVSIECLRLV